MDGWMDGDGDGDNSLTASGNMSAGNTLRPPKEGKRRCSRSQPFNWHRLQRPRSSHQAGRLILREKPSCSIVLLHSAAVSLGGAINADQKRNGKLKGDSEGGRNRGRGVRHTSREGYRTFQVDSRPPPQLFSGKLRQRPNQSIIKSIRLTRE